MAAEVVCSRWTALVLRELLMGSTRFNDIRRGVPRMSPTLLSKRLKELEEAGVVVTTPTGQAGVVDYRLTAAGEELRGIVDSLGIWGQRWVESQVTLKNLDPSLLMWDMRRNLKIEPLPPRRCTIKFSFRDSRQSSWLVVDGGKVDLCNSDPGYEVDLYVAGSLYSMTSVWMGHSTLKSEVDAGKIELTGDKSIANSMNEWLGLSPLAKAYRGKAA
jgi:DNA-binding HxlR family transcriptional regulator